LIYTLPSQFEARFPQIWSRLQGSSDYVKVKEFDGTLNGGDIIVLLKDPARQSGSPAN